MALKSKALKKGLKDKALENSQVTLGTKDNQQVLKSGVPNDHSVKHLSGGTVVGISLGSTINMENYESLRADVWLSDTVQEGETVEQAYQRVSSVVESTLQELVSQYTG